MSTKCCAIALFACLFAFAGCEADKPAARKAEVLKVVLAEAAVSKMPVEATFNATLAAKETVEVRSRISGHLVERLFAEGAHINEGDVIYRLDDRDLKAGLATAKANTAKAESTWKNDEITKDRYVPLAETGAVSKQERDRAVTKAEESLALYNAAKAEEDKATVNLGYATITAPITGYIARSNVEVGSYITEGSVLLTTMYRVDPIRAEFSVTDKELARLLQHGGGAKIASFRMELGDDRIPFKYPGALEMADPVVDPKTNTLGVRVAFPNPDNLLRPGLYVNVTAMVDQLDVITVPEVAVMDRDGGKAVFMVDAKNTIVAVPVKIGRLVGEQRVITEGLEAGQKVVVEGLVVAQPGMEVAVVAKPKPSPAP